LNAAIVPVHAAGLGINLAVNPASNIHALLGKKKKSLASIFWSPLGGNEDFICRASGVKPRGLSNIS